MRRASAAFTLVEVLVALAILALAMLLAYRATAALVDGEGRLAAEAARWRSLDASLARMEADFRQAIPSPLRAGGRREPAWLADIDGTGNSRLAFSRAGSEFFSEPGMAGQRIGYRLENGELQVVYGAPIGEAGDGRPVAYVLLHDVAQWRLAQLAQDGRWLDRWPAFGEAEIPRAVRVELTLADGAHIERWFSLR